MTQQDDIRNARQWLVEAGAIVVLTGAGVSADSGVPTFRGPDGLWEGHRVEDVATPEAFARDPEFVWRFYDQRRQRLIGIRPNPAHHALAALERQCPDVLISTQNIDDLHRAAGSRRVLELHGNIWRARCTGCGRVEEFREVPVRFPPTCGHCRGLLRPHVVWFGESLDNDVVDETVSAMRKAQVVLVIGTSGTVHPVAGFPLLARRYGARVIEVNTQPTLISAVANVSVFGRAGEIVPRLMARQAETESA